MARPLLFLPLTPITIRNIITMYMRFALHMAIKGCKEQIK